MFQFVIFVVVINHSSSSLPKAVAPICSIDYTTTHCNPVQCALLRCFQGPKPRSVLNSRVADSIPPNLCLCWPHCMLDALQEITGRMYCITEPWIRPGRYTGGCCLPVPRSFQALQSALAQQREEFNKAGGLEFSGASLTKAYSKLKKVAMPLPHTTKGILRETLSVNHP